ncbi:MAG: hypothetical protein MUF54_12140 [Polyangiaceae bacterium]|jgi:chromosome segregation ATPase|nr:hypothetical protein [Polyangiaceae bacterium]
MATTRKPSARRDRAAAVDGVARALAAITDAVRSVKDAGDPSQELLQSALQAIDDMRACVEGLQHAAEARGPSWKQRVEQLAGEVERRLGEVLETASALQRDVDEARKQAEKVELELAVVREEAADWKAKAKSASETCAHLRESAQAQDEAMKLADQRASEQHTEIARLDKQLRDALGTSAELGMELVQVKGQLAPALLRADNLERAMRVEVEKQAVVRAQQEAEVRRLAEVVATLEEQRDLALAAAAEIEIERDRALAAAAEREKERDSAVLSAAQAARELAAQQDEFIVNLTEDYEEKLASATRALQGTMAQSRDVDAAREQELGELRAASDALEHELREAREHGRRLEAERDEAVAEAERRSRELDEFAMTAQAAREAELEEVHAVTQGLDKELEAARDVAGRLQVERDESLRGLEAAQLELAESRKKLEADLLAGRGAPLELRSERDPTGAQPAMACASPTLRRDVEELQRAHDWLEQERNASMRALAELRMELTQAQGIIKQLEKRLASGEQQADDESGRGSRDSGRACRSANPEPACEADTFDGTLPGTYFVAGEAIREETVLRSARREGMASRKPTGGGATRRKR